MQLHPVAYHAPDDVQQHIQNLIRPEDITLSPDNQLFALADYNDNSIAVFKSNLASRADDETVYISHSLTIRSDMLDAPHGIRFINNQLVIVTNRGGDICLFAIPELTHTTLVLEQQPVYTFKARAVHGKIRTPSAVDIIPLGNNRYRVFVCNTRIHSIVAFDLLIEGNTFQLKNLGEVYNRGLRIPDGICISPDKRWAAVSNHDTHHVLIYAVPRFHRWLPVALQTLYYRLRKPVTFLSGVFYPHGIRFSHDGRRLFVADAGTPYLTMYENPKSVWKRHMRLPTQLIRTLSDELFDKEITSPEEGGLKGVEVSRDDQYLLTTAQHQSLMIYRITG